MVFSFETKDSGTRWTYRETSPDMGGERNVTVVVAGEERTGVKLSGFAVVTLTVPACTSRGCAGSFCMIEQPLASSSKVLITKAVPRRPRTDGARNAQRWLKEEVVVEAADIDTQSIAQSFRCSP